MVDCVIVLCVVCNKKTVLNKIEICIQSNLAILLLVSVEKITLLLEGASELSLQINQILSQTTRIRTEKTIFNIMKQFSCATNNSFYLKYLLCTDISRLLLVTSNNYIALMQNCIRKNGFLFFKQRYLPRIFDDASRELLDY